MLIFLKGYIMLFVIIGILSILVLIMNLAILEIVVRGKMNQGLTRKEAILEIFSVKKVKK